MQYDRTIRSRRTNTVIAMLAVVTTAATACVAEPAAPGATTAPSTTTSTTTTIDAPDIDIDGAQLRWGFGQYAQYGVFGPWQMHAQGADVSIATVDGADITGDAAEAGRPYGIAVFDGGTGSLDPVTGAGSVTWTTGDVTINAYPSSYGAPDEVFSDPQLTVAGDGSGSVSFEVSYTGGVDIEGAPIEGGGPERVTVVTFDSIDELGSGSLTVVPDYLGRAYVPTEGAPVLIDCPTAGSWPSEFINFLHAAVRPHYYATGCGGLNDRKFPLPVTIDWTSSAPAITAQPTWPGNVETGTAVTLSVGSNLAVPAAAHQWQVSTNNGGTWTDIAGATGDIHALTLTEANAAHFYRVELTNPLGSVVSAPVGATSPVPASIVVQPTNVEVGISESVNIQLQATGTPLPEVRWQTSTDGETWVDHGASTFVSPRTFRTSFAATSVSENGTKFRAILNPDSADPVISDVVEVTVLAQLPEVSAHPVSATVWEGTFFTLSTDALSRPFPSNLWEVSTDGGTTWAPVDHVNNNYFTLILSATNELNGAQFRAKVSNAVGDAYSDVATLTVLAKTGEKRLFGIPGFQVDPTVASTLRIYGEGYTPPADVAGNITIAIVEQGVWEPGQPAPAAAATVARATVGRAALVNNGGLISSQIIVGANRLDPTKTYGVAVYSATATVRHWDEWHPLTVVAP